jgi:hypothetical protein
MRKFLPLLGLLLVACTATPSTPSLPAPRFTDEAPITLRVGKIEIANEFHSPAQPPHVEYRFDYPPADMLRAWVDDRIRAGGGEDILEVTIKDASVVAADLPKTQGLKGVFTVDQSKRYDGRFEVEMRIYKPGDAISETQISASATRSITEPENTTLQQRDKLFYDLGMDMTRAVGKELKRNIQQYFANYIE